MSDASPLSDLVERQLEIASLTGEIDSVMRAIVDGARESLAGDGAALTIHRGDELVFTVAVGSSAPLAGSTIPVAGTLGGRCFEERRTLVIDDLLDEPTAEPEHTSQLEGGSMVLAPLVHGDRTLGVLSVHARQRGGFTAEAAASVGLLARSAAIALRNAELVAHLASAERASRALVEQGADAMLVLDPDGAVLAGNDAAASLLGYARAELLELRDTDLFTDEETASGTLRGAILQRRHELRGERAFRRKDGSFVDVELAARLLDDGRIHTSLRDITQRKRNEDRLHVSLDRLRAIVEMQREISELVPEPDAVTEAILERAQQLTRADGAVVLRLEPDGPVWRHGSGAAAAYVGYRADPKGSLAGLVLSSGETHYAPDTLVDPRVDAEATRRTGFRSVISSPLLRGSVPVAVLSVASRRPHAFDEIAVETTRLMAEFVSAALRNTEELELRRQMAEELRTQGHVVENMRTALHVWALGADNVFRLEYANAASEHAMDIPVADVLGRRIEEVLPGSIDDAEPLFRRLLASEGGIFDAGEVEYGDERVSPRIFAMKMFALGPTRVAVTFENVTERVRAGRALRESEARFRGAFDAASVGMALVTLDDEFVQVNDRLAEMLGYTPAELMPLGVRGVTLPSDLDIVRRSAERLERGDDESVELEKHYVRKDGSLIWARVSIALVRDYDGRPVHRVVHLIDLTRQRDLELQLRQAQRMEAVGRLAGGIAHDFNNLLTAISGYSELLTSAIDDPKLRRHADEIAQAAARAASLTGRLLAFSRRQALQPRVLDLNDAVAELEAILRRLLGEDVELAVILDAAPAWVQADPTQIEQLIVSLAVDAREAMPAGGSATIRTANVDAGAGALVELSFTDTGVGPSRQERQQLLDPLLETIHGIVERSGGTIEIDAEPGVGSTFRARLPCAAEVERESPAALEAPAAGNETILLVEDESVVRQLVAEILETSGYTVLRAADGPSALEMLRRHAGPVDLLVTDVVMPGMSGPDVAKAVGAMRPGLQVLYTSGYTDSAIDRHGVLRPGIAFLQKPFSADDLTRKVRALVEEPAGDPA